MGKIILKSSIASVLTSIFLMIVFFGGLLAYALLSFKSVNVYNLYSVNVSDDGMYMLVSPGILLIVIITFVFFVILFSTIFLIKGRTSNESKTR